MSAGSIFRKFPATFWVANAMELFERWAWYGMFMVLALYLTGSTDTGALGFSQEQKGILMGTVVAILYVLPIITGAIADRIGYKITLAVAFAILSSGYYLMGRFQSYEAMFFVFLYVALGAGLFKPVIAATIAKTTTTETSSIGFGVFYMIVNIGAFIGPIFASKLRVISWNHVFVMASVIIALNFILLIFFFKEPVTAKKKESIISSIKVAFSNIYTALRDVRLLVFLFLIIGFWTMYNQLFYTLPVFIEQWVDTTRVYRALEAISPALAAAIGTDSGTVAPEMMTNVDAMYIVLFQVMVSALVMRYNPLNVMISGIFLSGIGIGLTFMTGNGLFIIASVFLFALGEMASSPKIMEYLGRLAPPDKTALYLGTYFLPLAGGNFFAGLLSGNVYGKISDKTTLLQQEVAARGLDIPPVSEAFSSNDYFQRAGELMGLDQPALTQFLWETYHPYKIWMLFAGIGIATALLLFIYDRLVMKGR